MTTIEVFEFSPFAENTYIVSDETKECLIVDPGCFFPQEKAALRKYILDNELKPVRLLNTHCHLDHIFGNNFVFQSFGLYPELHEGELPVLQAAPQIAKQYGLPPMEPSPMPQRFIEEGEIVTFGNTELKALYTPGHSPASLSFYCEPDDFVLCGDVLFYGSIGRTDLPGGNMTRLLRSVRSELFTLPGHTSVLPGHGPGTTVRHEKEYNPFFT